MAYRNNRRSFVVDSTIFSDVSPVEDLREPVVPTSPDGSQPEEEIGQSKGEEEKEKYAEVDNEATHGVQENETRPLQSQRLTTISEQENGLSGSTSAYWATSRRQGGTNKRASKASTTLSWHTAISNRSLDRALSMASFHTARSSLSENISSVKKDRPRNKWMEAIDNPWMRAIAGIVDRPSLEHDWSGKGQHVEFADEKKIPLKVEGVLGFGTALVESVRCRRVRLARKTMFCSVRLRKEDAVKEVAHLQRLQHTHVIRVVGTYVCGRKMSILLYPVAEYTLDTYMDEMRNIPTEELGEMRKLWGMRGSFETFFSCLTTAIAFIHENLIKHMDIKPKNILVKKRPTESINPLEWRYHVIVADFGISRSYGSAMESYTESPTSFTRAYAAPEVVDQGPRDFSADIFSLGCVFVEMLATLESIGEGYHILYSQVEDDQKEAIRGRIMFSDQWLHEHIPVVDREDVTPPEQLASISSWERLSWLRKMNSDYDTSYQANANSIVAWLASSFEKEPTRQIELSEYDCTRIQQFETFTALVCNMLNFNTQVRPTSLALKIFLYREYTWLGCHCNPKPDPYEVIKD
ncbi:kinase-like protein [Polyplosphaeria fusca]|uniref:Kinase-like protein n=1 Tax=Polyplosphaeria fusca TaxID=682080 RepID=A0A9P4UXW7_9PLEO|nr:kinase-like protein [Polyplosphaeria fusca]